MAASSVNIRVNGMLCREYCESTVVEELRKAPGVKTVTLVDFDQGIIKVDYSGRSASNPSALVAVVEKLGYEAEVEGGGTTGLSSSSTHEYKEVEIAIEGMTW